MLTLYIKGSQASDILDLIHQTQILLLWISLEIKFFLMFLMHFYDTQI